MLTRTNAFPHITFTKAQLENFATVTARLKATGDAGAYDAVRLPKWGIVTVWADGEVTIMGTALLRPAPAAPSVTDEQIEELRASYDSSGNLEMRAICTRALGEKLTPGDRRALKDAAIALPSVEQARAECAAVILSADRADRGV
jgi:hypothetical protein